MLNLHIACGNAQPKYSDPGQRLLYAYAGVSEAFENM